MELKIGLQLLNGLEGERNLKQLTLKVLSWTAGRLNTLFVLVFRECLFIAGIVCGNLLNQARLQLEQGEN